MKTGLSLFLLVVAALTGTTIAHPVLAQPSNTVASPPSDSEDSNVMATITVGSFPRGVVYDSGNGYVYVVNADPEHSSGSVSVFDGTTVVRRVMVGAGPSGIAYDSGNGLIYVANHDENTVSVINGTTVVETIPVGGGPIAVAYDGGNGYIYVTNSFSGTTSVISTATGFADFVIFSRPASLNVMGESGVCEGRSTSCDDEASTVVSVESLNGFTDNVRLRASVSPSDGSLLVYCRPPRILVMSGRTSNASCTVEAEINPDLVRLYFVTISATNGTLSHSTTFSVVVFHAPLE